MRAREKKMRYKSAILRLQKVVTPSNVKLLWSQITRGWWLVVTRRPFFITSVLLKESKREVPWGWLDLVEGEFAK